MKNRYIQPIIFFEMFLSVGFVLFTIYVILEFFGNLFSNIRYILKLPKPLWFFSLFLNFIFFYFISFKTNFLIGFILSFSYFTIINYFGNFIERKELELQKNKICLITGVGENGIGYFMAKKYLELEGTVILACRNEKKTLKIIENLKKETKNEKIFFFELDLNSLNSIKNFSKKLKEKFKKIDILINNAGLASNPNEKTKDGFEMCIGVNYIALYCLSIELLDILGESEDGRIINTSSSANQPAEFILDDFKGEIINGGFKAYETSKLFVNMFTKELQLKFDKQKSKISIYSFHPGVVFTEIWKKNFPKLIYPFVSIFLQLRMMSAEVGSLSATYLATNSKVHQFRGNYFFKCKVWEENELVKNENKRIELWNRSEEIYKKYFK